MTKRKTLSLVVVLTFSIGLAVVWYARERAARSIPPPPPEFSPDALLFAATVVSSPRLQFDEGSSTNEVAERRGERFSDTRTWQPEEEVEQSQSEVEPESDPVQLPDLSTLTVEDILALMEEDDQEVLQALLQALVDNGNASLPLLDAMLDSDRWRLERMAVMALSQIETTEARVTGISRLLTREQARRRGWHRLASMMGRNLNGEMVDLLAAMAEEAEGDALRRIHMMMHHVRDEDGLFRLYMLAEEHENAAIQRTARQTVFRGRRPASVPLLQDIMFAHEDPDVAELAARGLARGGRREGIAFLAETGSSDQPESELAIRALEQARSPRSHQALSEVAGSQEYGADVRLAAVRALGNSMRPQRARRFLAQVAENADAIEVREAAAALLEDREP